MLVIILILLLTFSLSAVFFTIAGLNNAAYTCLFFAVGVILGLTVIVIRNLHEKHANKIR